MGDVDTARRIDAVRRFNRFYTRQIGLLQESYLSSSLPLAEVRIIYELAQRDTATATELCADLGLDPGYLSRLLTHAQKRGLIDKRRSVSDGRQSLGRRPTPFLTTFPARLLAHCSIP